MLSEFWTALHAAQVSHNTWLILRGAFQEDVCTLSPNPIILTAAAWQELVALAEKLARETFAVEKMILQSPKMLKTLSLPWQLRRKLGAMEYDAGRHLRLTRFDFHFTTDGWRISEANTDVPGGFNEASGFTKLMANHYGFAVPPGDPAGAIVNAIREAVGGKGTVALVHATAFADDRQVVSFLSRQLHERGLQSVMVAPDHLRWENGIAFVSCDWANGPVDFVFRFFPAEWLPALPRHCGWPHLLGMAKTPICNPGIAIISQSKRLPLIWNDLSLDLPTWRAMLPKTFAVRDVPWRGPDAEGFVFKPALGRVGDMIGMHGVTPEKELRTIKRSLRWHPRDWVAQERFDAVPMATTSGNVFPCIGVYTLNETVIGSYGRVARQPLINHLAQDAAVLIAGPNFNPQPNPTSDDALLRTLQTVGA